jgi:hypothetical protein
VRIQSKAPCGDEFLLLLLLLLLLSSRYFSQRGEAATKVAQVSNLLYRGFPIRWRFDPRTVCRLEVGDTADWKSALLALVALGIIEPQMHEMD